VKDRTREGLSGAVKSGRANVSIPGGMVELVCVRNVCLPSACRREPLEISVAGLVGKERMAGKQQKSEAACYCTKGTRAWREGRRRVKV
jgi:hypothetical protein